MAVLTEVHSTYIYSTDFFFLITIAINEFSIAIFLPLLCRILAHET